MEDVKLNRTAVFGLGMGVGWLFALLIFSSGAYAQTETMQVPVIKAYPVIEKVYTNSRPVRECHYEFEPNTGRYTTLPIVPVVVGAAVGKELADQDDKGAIVGGLLGGLFGGKKADYKAREHCYNTWTYDIREELLYWEVTYELFGQIRNKKMLTNPGKYITITIQH